jgi:hypothetical protein
MITFKQFLEGKAINATSDMEKFAIETINILKKDDWEYQKVAHERIVDGGKYGKKLIKVIPDEDKDTDTNSAWADNMDGLVGIFVKHGQNYGEEQVEIIIHELIHIFDPKLNNPELRTRKWGIDAPNKSINPSDDPVKNQEYHMNPWEQDAYMTQSARQIIKIRNWLYDGDWAQIQDSIKNLTPNSPWEITWKKDQKTWRKFLNTIYQELLRQKQQNNTK